MLARAFGLFFGIGLMTICVGCFFYLVVRYRPRVAVIGSGVLLLMILLAVAAGDWQ